MNKVFVLFAVVLLQSLLLGQTELQKISVNDAIAIGLKNNPEIKSALENISSSKGRFWSGISLPQPEMSFSYEYVPINKNLNNASEKSWGISQSFEFPSNYFLKGNKLNKEEDIAVNKLMIAKRSVINKIKAGYYKVLAKQKQAELAEENLKIAEDFFKKAEIRENVGEGTNLEKLTAKVQLSEAGNNLIIIKNELISAYADLNYSLGNGSQNQNYVLTDSLVFVDYKIDVGKIYEYAGQENPQIKIAKLENEIASVEKGLAWSSILPNFNLAYFKQTLDGDNGYYGASFGISIPLWFAVDQRGKIQEATANESKSESDYQLTKNEIFLKLKSALLDQENNFKQVKMYRDEILPQSEEVYSAALKSYDAGEISYLEYLQAKQLLVNSKNNYINSLLTHYQTIFSIEEITGIKITDKSEPEN
jgi:cobalt-zinc-cadmium resistance protein CzcA